MKYESVAALLIDIRKKIIKAECFCIFARKMKISNQNAHRLFFSSHFPFRCFFMQLHGNFPLCNKCCKIWIKKTYPCTKITRAPSPPPLTLFDTQPASFLLYIPCRWRWRCPVPQGLNPVVSSQLLPLSDSSTQSSNYLTGPSCALEFKSVCLIIAAFQTPRGTASRGFNENPNLGTGLPLLGCHTEDH